MRPIANFAVHAFAATALIAFAATGAAAGGYLKLGNSNGQAAGKGHDDRIEVESWSWGATGSRGLVGKDGAKGGNVEFEWKVEEGESAPPAPDGWIADVERPQAARQLPGRRTPPTVTLKRGTSAAGTADINIGPGELQEVTISKSSDKSTAAAGHHGRGIDIAAVDGQVSPSVGGSQSVTVGGAQSPSLLPTRRQHVSIQAGPEGASGLPTGKRQHKPVLARPLARGSLTVKGSLPGCTVGARYPDAVLQTAASRYELKDVVISSCGRSAGQDDGPEERITFVYGSMK